MLSYLNKLKNPLLESQDGDFNFNSCGSDNDVKLTNEERRERYKYYEDL